VSGAKISAIKPNSPVADLDICVGDELLAVNGREPTDIIEYQQLIDGETVTLLLQREDRPLRHQVRISKMAGEPLGLSIDSAVFDRIRTCDNHCTFCFIYQLPKGMRRSLYVKDDDFRLSFLYGNYTTLTRFTEFDLERVVDERLSPLYVSIHTTNPDRRADMLRNPRGATSLRWLRALLDAGIEVHGQVVVCPGVNDGIELEETLVDALTNYADLASLSVVPIGISDFSNETSMRAHLPDEARDVVRLVTKYQTLGNELLGRKTIFASDEFYLVAELSTPGPEDYPSLDQSENGVGLVAAFGESFTMFSPMDKLGSGFFQSVDGAPALGYRAPRTLDDHEPEHASSDEIAILTGEYAAPILRRLLDQSGFDDVAVVPVINHYFGGNIKVAGLLTGNDINNTLASRDAKTTYLLPDLCLSEGRFLDGLSLEDVRGNVRVIPTTGFDLRNVLHEWRQQRLVLV